jgi:hypothetical protein
VWEVVMADVAMFDHLGRVKRVFAVTPPLPLPPAAPENIPANVSLVLIAGYAAHRDAPMATYVLIGNNNNNSPGCFQSNDGRWWGLQPTGDFLDVRWFGAKVDIAVDDKDALNDAIRCAMPQAQSGRDLFIRTVFIPAGTMRVSDTIYLRGVELRGAGILATTIALSQTGGTCIRMDGGAGLIPKAKITGGGLQSITLWPYTALNGIGVEVAGGKGIHLAGDFEFQPDEAVFGDLKITGGGTWEYPLYLDGRLRVPIPNMDSLTGLRRITLRNLFLGRATSKGLYVHSVKGLTIYNMGIYGSKTPGTTYSFDMEITGTEGMRSEGIQFFGADIQGTAWVYYTEAMTLSGKLLQVSFAAGAKGCVFYGTLTTGSAGSGYYGGTGNGNEKYVATL